MKQTSKTGLQATITPFTQRVIALIRAIPAGKVATYGQIAALAGDARAARQVARILHACSGKYKLPWQRVIGANGHVTLPRGAGFEEQCLRLAAEGVIVAAVGRIKLDQFLWRPDTFFSRKSARRTCPS